MKIYLLLSFLAATCALAQEKPANADAPPVTIQSWLATNDVTWQAAFQKDVTGVYEAETAKLKQQYAAALDALFAKARDAGDLDGSLTLRTEQKRFSETNEIPSEDGPAELAPVKQLRNPLRSQFARMEKERAARAKALLAQYDNALALAQAQLTQRQRIDDAVLVKRQRETVSAAWKPSLPEKPAPAAPAPAVNPIPRTVRATIPANSADAFPLGELRRGTKVSLQYEAGKWKAWGRLATSSPDEEKGDGGGDCRLVVALPAVDGRGGEIITVVPPETKTQPFVFEAKSDYPSVVLRIKGRGNTFTSNPGSAEYTVTISPPAR